VQEELGKEREEIGKEREETNRGLGGIKRNWAEKEEAT
jgi:hypothetical protein